MITVLCALLVVLVHGCAATVMVKHELTVLQEDNTFP